MTEVSRKFPHKWLRHSVPVCLSASRSRSIIPLVGTNDATKERPGVDHGHQIKRKLFLHDRLIDGICLDVAKWDIKADEAEENGKRKENVWNFPPS